MTSAPDDPFARVAQERRHGHASAARATTSEGELVAPVPSAASGPRFRHGRLGDPGHAPWEYRAADGQLLFYVARYPKAREGEEALPRDAWTGKDVLPLTLWREAGGRLKWRFKAYPEPRPLYGLPRLAQRPDVPVLIVEGEKTADAACGVFPDFAVTTWPGGSKAVAKVDWSPLSGRVVVIVPDADQAGRDAALKVANHARAAGALSVGVAQLPAGLPPGWDLADALPAGVDLAAIVQAVSAAIEAPSCDAVLPFGFKLDSHGLWWAPQADPGGKPQPPQWLCAAFEVRGMARDEDGHDWSLVVEFRDLDGRRKREIIGRAEMAGDGVEVRRRLMGAGLQIASSRSARERLQTALCSIVSPARLRLASATGWKGALYVLPHRTVGAATIEPVIFRGGGGGTHHAEAGSYNLWREDVAAPMLGNSIGVFALSCAFAAPLLRPLNAEGGGFHLRGASSTGKTSALQAAGSVWGGGGPLGYCQSWRHTDNALEAVALAHNDCLIGLDELRSLEPDAAGKAAYSLATGMTKGRLKSDSELRQRPSWKVMLLSTGELSLADLIRLARGRDKAYAGQELRLIDVSVDMGAGLGAWEDIHGAETPARFSDAIKRATEAHFGHAGPLFVERFLAARAEMETAAERIRDGFLAMVLEQDDIGQASRGAQRFAMAAVAGELAALLDVVPWPPGVASAAAARLFQRWAATFGRKRQREDREAFQKVRAFLERFEHSRFRSMKDGLTEDERLQAERQEGDKPREGEARSMDAAGWRTVQEGRGVVFHFNPEFWRDDLFAGMDARAAARALKEAGFLVSNGEAGRLTNKVAGPWKGKRNFYSVLGSILEADADDLD